MSNPVSQLPEQLDFVSPVLEPSHSPAEWLSAMRESLRSDIFSNTWSLSQGAARRVTFVYPKNDVMVSLVCNDDAGDAADLHLWGNSTYDFADLGTAGSHKPSWNPETATFVIEDLEATDAAVIITGLAGIHGVPDVVLPWEEFRIEAIDMLDGVLDNIDGSCLAEMWAHIPAEDRKRILEEVDACIEEAGEVTDEGSLVLLFAHIGGLSPFMPGSKTILAMGDSHLPADCMHYRFIKAASAIENLPDWVVAWDECCGACARGTYEMLTESKGLDESAPSLTLFGQNSQFYFLPDGTVHDYTVYLGNADQVSTVLKACSDANLPARDVSNKDNFIVEMGV